MAKTTDIPVSQPRKFNSYLLNYEELHYIPIEQKDNLWAAKNLAFAKYHGKPLVDATIAAKKRALDRGEINEADYKKIFDPEDGKAEFVAADWKSNPVYIHLNNIVEANIAQTPNSITVKAVDEYAKSKQQKENARIINRREYLAFLNGINDSLGLPRLKDTDDPYKYAKEMQQLMQQDGGADKLRRKNPGATKMGKTATPDGMVDAIKSSIYDNEDLALYNEYIYKGDVEIAIELGIQHYLKENKYHLIGEKVVADLRNFNTACMWWYTSQTNGKPVIEHLAPETVYTSEFSEIDGTDIVHWFREYDITFSDFTRQFGANLTDKQLIEVFERNRHSFGNHGLDWNRCSGAAKSGARIRVGYLEFETQNREIFTDGVMKGNVHFKRRDEGWQESPNTRKSFRKERVERNYSIWYRCFYIPPTMGTTVHATSIEWQKDFIFNLEPIQDQIHRYGDNRRWAKCSLVVWKNPRISFSDIMERFMPKINFLWLKFQNNLANDQNGVIYADELVKAMMLITDEADLKGKEAKKELLRRLKQTGTGVSKFTDGEGKYFKPFEVFRSGHLASAADELVMMQNLYVMMRQSLGINEIAEGNAPKPRQSLGAIDMAMQATNKSTFFFERGWDDMTTETAERLTTYIKKISEEGDTERFEDFKDIVGQANGLLLEEIEDIPLHKLGLSIERSDTDKQIAYIQGLAEKLVNAGMLDVEVLPLLLKIENPKYAAVLMIMKYKQKVRQKMEQDEMAHRRALEMKGAELDVELAKYRGKEEAKATISMPAQAEISAQLLQLEGQIKALGQSMLGDQRKNNRIEERAAQANIEQQQQNQQNDLVSFAQ